MSTNQQFKQGSGTPNLRVPSEGAKGSTKGQGKAAAQRSASQKPLSGANVAGQAGLTRNGVLAGRMPTQYSAAGQAQGELSGAHPSAGHALSSQQQQQLQQLNYDQMKSNIMQNQPMAKPSQTKSNQIHQVANQAQFASPNRVKAQKLSGHQAQSHQQLPQGGVGYQQKGGNLFLGVSGPLASELEHHQSHQMLLNNSKGNQSILNLNNQKQINQKSSKKDIANSVYGQQNQRQLVNVKNFQGQQKYMNAGQMQKSAGKTAQHFNMGNAPISSQKQMLKNGGGAGGGQAQITNFSNTQNVNNKQMKLGYQGQLVNTRGSSQHSGGRVDGQDPRGATEQPNVYNDGDHEAYARSKNLNGTGAGSGAGTRSQNSRLAKAQGQTAGVSHTLQGNEAHGSGEHGAQQENSNSKTLYTNVSLRELTQSPETRGITNQEARPNSKIQIAGALDGKQPLMKNRIYQNTQFISNKRVLQGASQERPPNYQSQGQLQQIDQRLFNNTSLSNYQNNQQFFNPNGKRDSGSSQNIMNQQQMDFDNQLQLKNYLSQLQQNGTQPLAANKKENGSILNIKTVQDINIYNNSFIINSSNLPQNLQNQQVPHNQNVATQELQVAQAKLQMQNQVASQATTVSGGKKGGLKLRKELSGLSTGLNQARSASQGRSNARGASSSSNQPAVNQISNGPSRNTAALTEYNSYGAIQTGNNLQKISRGYDAYNQNIRAQNIQSLQQNPNQKRILNPTNKVFGNLTAIGGIQSSGSLSQKQTAKYAKGKSSATGNYYQNNTKALKQGGISKVLKGMLSSNTSRVGSRTDSRAGTRLNNGTLDKIPAAGSLTSDSRAQGSDINLANQNQSTIQQMKKNYLTNQQMMIAGGAGPHGQVQNGRNQPQFKSQSRASNHSQLLVSKGPGAAQSQMINIHDISAGGRADLNHSQLAGSDLHGGLSNLHSQSQLYQSQKYNVHHGDSYEARKQSLQELRNKNGGGQTAQKFRNQPQQLSSDNKDALRTPMGVDAQGQFVNSMSIKNEQYFQNQGESDGQTGNSKMMKEFIDKQKALAQALLKIKKLCQVVPGGEKEKQKETEMKNILQQLDQFQLKVSKVKKAIQQQGEEAGLERILERVIEHNQEATVLRALCLLDQGQNYESIQEFDKICGIQTLLDDFNATKLQHSAEGSQGSDQLLKMNMEAQGKDSAASKTKMCQVLMSIAQKRTGEHLKSLETITNCIEQFPDFKDAYLVRGQQHLLNKQHQKALQDLMKFDQLVNSEILEQQRTAKNPQLLNQLSFQLCLGRELIGDAYKRTKKYKQASKSYQEALNEVFKLQKIKMANYADKLQHFATKIQIKIAMCAYYLGQVTKAISLFKDQLQYLSKFNPTLFKVQQKQIKCNFFLAKSLLAQKQLDQSGSPEYQSALKYLSLCNGEEIDPELHELYCGNSLFEIFKIFIKQKDIYNAHEYIQRATDNNFNSKRMSLYRDFTEGVMYLMKRKIKKGVQILTDLLEILINGQKEIEKINLSNKKEKTAQKQEKRDRYNVDESDSQLMQQKMGNSSIEQSTITGKASEIGSGKFNQEQYDFLIFNIYVYRSYGYVAIEKYEHALEDLRKAKAISPTAIDKAAIYNKWLSRGILKMDTEEYLMASKYFGKASLRFQSNKDAFCLNVISIVRSYSFSLSKLYMDNEQKREKIMQTKRFLDVAITCCCKEQKQPSLYFFRGLLHYQLHNFYDALSDFNVAIQEEEEATGQFHLARGRCYACLSILDEAMKDLSIALELDETLQEAYIFRGKCAYLLGDNNLAFHDFQKLIISDQKNPIVHIYAGNLLMTTGAYTDAVKAFDNADTVQQTSLAAFQRIRCYCALSDLENAFEQMQLCQHQAPHEKFAQYDYKVLLPLLSCVRSFAFSRNEDGDPDESGKVEQIKILENCVSQISSIIEVYEKNEHLELKKEKSPMTIQIIPNVNKIKIEKRLVQKHLMNSKNATSTEVALSPQARKELDGVATHGYYRENIFQLEEMYLYRSIFQLYIGNMQESLTDLTKSWKQHFQSTVQAKKEAVAGGASSNNGMGIDTNMTEEMYGKFPMSQLVSPMGSVHSFHTQKTDLSEVGLCSLNVNEYTYNQLILFIQQKNWQSALKKVNELLSTNPATAEQSKSLKQLFVVRAMINQELGLTDKYNQDLTIYLKNFGQIKKNKHNAVVIEPFDAKGRLCSQFDPIPMNFTPPKTKGSFAIWMRPSFSMPFIKPPNMIPNIDEEEVQSEFNLKQIDAPMPEAPWVRQCQNQNFQPENYLIDFQQTEQEVPKSAEAKRYAELPADADSQQFLTKYFENDHALIYDEKIQEDIDDLSDTDKVSLISDIELAPANDKEEQSPAQKSKGDVDLHLKKISQITQEKKTVSRVNNGIGISQQKYLCGHKRRCSSCYALPVSQNMVNVSNLEQLIEILTLTKEEKQQRMRELDFYRQADGGKDAGGKATSAKDRMIEFEDTVSDFELESSEEEEEEKTEAKQSNSEMTKEKRDVLHLPSHSSKYTHSRFSSNAGDLTDLEDEISGIRADLAAEDIDAQDLQIEALNNKGKRLLNDHRNILKKDAGGADGDINQNFTHKITSIQRGNEFEPEEDEQQTPQQKKPSKKGADRDSLVNLGSKNMEKLHQKKKKKSSGIGGANNLKKNKLAIAFNNLEMEQHNPASDGDGE